MTEPVDPSTAPTESDALIASSSQFRVDSCVHYFKDEINGHVRFNLIKLRKEEGTYQADGERDGHGERLLRLGAADLDLHRAFGCAALRDRQNLRAFSLP